VNSISSFNKHLSVLERTSPARLGPSGPTGPVGVRRATVMTRSEARRRRRDVLYVLGGAALVTLMLAVLLGGPFVWLQVLADVALLSYVVLLVQTQRLATERRNKVRYLSPVGAVTDLESPYLVPQASANY
jgi:hypothetical protein